MEMRNSICQNVDQNYNCSVSQELIKAYSQWIQQYIDNYGWNPFLMTFMFKPLKGRQEAIMQQMNDEVDRVYSTFITRVVRKPNSVYQRYLYSRPLLIAVPDRPVAKHAKQRLKDVTINDGRHMHGILVVPWDCRLKQDVVSHFDKFRQLYVKNRLLRINIKPIDCDLGGVVDYAFKSIKNRKFDCDDVLIFPKAEAELRARRRSKMPTVKGAS